MRERFFASLTRILLLASFALDVVSMVVVIAGFRNGEVRPFWPPFQPSSGGGFAWAARALWLCLAWLIAVPLAPLRLMDRPLKTAGWESRVQGVLTRLLQVSAVLVAAVVLLGFMSAADSVVASVLNAVRAGFMALTAVLLAVRIQPDSLSLAIAKHELPPPPVQRLQAEADPPPADFSAPQTARPAAPSMPLIPPPVAARRSPAAAQHRTACPKCSAPIGGRRCECCGIAIEAGGYVVDRVLSESGQTRTYLAHDAVGEQVFLKELVFLLVPDLAVLEAFEREGALLKQLNHPSVPRYAASFAEGEGLHLRLYLAERYVDGQSLLGELERRRYSEEELRAIALEILGVLRYLHSRTPPIIHRDVKPANIVRGADQKLALVDFGSARDAAVRTTQGATQTGTLGYAPAEQLAGIVSPGSDIYGLAATLMHLLTRKAPWESLASGGQPNPRAFGVSRSFAAWLTRALDLRPSKRFKSADDAIAALQRNGPPARHIGLVLGVLLASLAGAVVFNQPSLRSESVGRAAPAAPRVRPVDTSEDCPENATIGGTAETEQFCQTRSGDQLVRNGVSATYNFGTGKRKVSVLAHYRDNLLDGDYVRFNWKNEKAEAGKFVAGVRQGQWRLNDIDEGTLVDGKRQGEWIQYYPDKRVVFVRTTYADDKKNGPSVQFSFDGHKLSEATWVNDQRDGTTTDYFANGKVKSVTTYSRGRQHGPVTQFDVDGRKLSTANFASGSTDGVWTEYFSDGSVSSSSLHQLGTEVAFTQFFPGGAKREEWHFDRGAMTASRITFDANGLKRVEETPGRCGDDPNAPPDSSCRTEYFADGKVQRRCDLDSPRGQRGHRRNVLRVRGLCREWHENGALMSEGTASGEERTGTWRYYWPNKKLMRIESYEGGHLSGEQREYFENGRLKLSGQFERGAKKDVWIERAADGRLISKRDYGQ